MLTYIVTSLYGQSCYVFQVRAATLEQATRYAEAYCSAADSLTVETLH